jgi:muramoyltetrapeptide carboxypeptidase
LLVLAAVFCQYGVPSEALSHRPGGLPAQRYPQRNVPGSLARDPRLWTSRVIVHKPAPLKKGGTIGVVAPAGCVDEGELLSGVKAIRDRGFNVELSESIASRKGYLAGGAEERARDLERFFSRGDIDAIFSARGGFGSVQTLPLLQWEFTRHAKIFVGYSDITILLNWLLQAHGLVTFHGPMVAMDFAQGLSEASADRFWGILTGDKGAWTCDLGEVIRPGQAVAPMMGGCLSLLVTTLGTPYEIDSRGKLLFLEDVGEKPYRIERMLTHLKMAGKLDGVAGVILGNFVDCNGEGSRDVRQIVAEIFSAADYPVVMGLAAGHGEENLLLPFGVAMALEASPATLSIVESPVA